MGQEDTASERTPLLALAGVFAASRLAFAAPGNALPGRYRYYVAPFLLTFLGLLLDRCLARLRARAAPGGA